MPDNWYDLQYTPGSMLVLDEAQLWYNCRNYADSNTRKMYEKILRYLTMCRHYDLEIIFITQNLERLDVQIRQLATNIIRYKHLLKFYYIDILHGFKLRSVPILQIGRQFDDDVELEHYMNSQNENYKTYGKVKLHLVSLPALKYFDSHIYDKEYLDKDFIQDHIWNLETYKGQHVCNNNY